MQRTTKADGQAFKPSAKQIYGIAHATLELLGLDWPADRESASVLYARLLETNRAAQGSTAEGMAF
jgi:hypothetical protein